MNKYYLVSTWKIKASMEEVWEALRHPGQWPEWWKGLIAVKELKNDGPGGMHAIQRYIWGVAGIYTLTFDMQTTNIRKYHLIEGKVWGDVEGKGTWIFEEEDGIVTLTYYWDIRIMERWMNLLSTFLRPLVLLGHRQTMKRGAQGLAKYLGAELLEAK